MNSSPNERSTVARRFAMVGSLGPELAGPACKEGTNPAVLALLQQEPGGSDQVHLEDMLVAIESHRDARSAGAKALSKIVQRRRFVYTFLVALSLGGLLAAAVVSAQEGGEGAKRPAQRDAPGQVKEDDFPPGEHIYELSAPRMHGGILIYPPGQDPPLVENPDATRNWRYTKLYTLDAARDAGLIINADALPAGYSATSGSALRADKPDGSYELTTAGMTLEGPGYPISVHRAKPSQHYANQPYALPAWLESNVMTTLGSVEGQAAVFVHRRAGVETEELQQVFVKHGDWVILVEGYVDEFAKLIRIAESIVRNGEI